MSALPESNGELPSAAMAEEILTPGEGQVRGMVTIAGNPVLSTPNGRKLEAALQSLEFMVSIDIYENETTRHADLILPPTSSLNHDHYDRIFYALSIRNATRFNEAIWPRPEDERYDWEIFAELGTRLAAKLNREFKPVPPTRFVVESTLARNAGSSPTFDDLRNAPHGIDLGPLTPSLYDRLETPDAKIHCAPEVLVADIPRFMAHRHSTDGAFALIGRRHLRSNNSWMHNSHRLTKGQRRDQLLMHPDDLASLGIDDGADVEMHGPGGTVRIAVKATDTMMPGAVSLPHSYPHASYNDVAGSEVDAVSGNAALNGVRVRIVAASK